jgi:hypothetical protein
MPPTIAASIIDLYCQTHQRLLRLAERLDDAQLHWRATPESHTIAFHLWHVARWADHFTSAIPGMTEALQARLDAPEQVWEREDLAAKWGFTPEELGFDQTGMTMSDDEARALPFPDRAELLGYAREVFAAAERMVRAVDEKQFHAVEQPQSLTEGVWNEGTVGEAILTHAAHACRHLGAVECLAGMQLGSGTATR